ncbi:MAG: hypothetical protein ACTSXM_06765 [Promethearchaeota archaeon]
MPYIVKKLIPIYSKSDNVPKQYLNLRKVVYVTTFKYLYPNVTDILIKQYGLKPEEKIVIFYMKEISLPHFNRYRTRFRKIYSGSVENLVNGIINNRSI